MPRAHYRSGFALATMSAAAFALSGPLAKTLIEAGWSSEAAVLIRLAGGALVLSVPVLVASLPSRGRMLTSNAGHLLAYGVIAMAGIQVGFFNAIKTLPIALALLIEYVGPVLVVAFLWVSRGQRPSRLTLAGGVIAMAGVVVVLQPWGGFGLDPAGVAWSLFAAACLAGYFLLSAHQPDDLPAMVTVGVGAAVAAVLVCLLGVIGILDLTAGNPEVVLTDHQVPWWSVAIVLALVTAVFSYRTGIAAASRLGARLASFAGLLEVLFTVLFAWLMFSELPTQLQAVGGALIVAGIFLVKLGEPVEPSAVE